MRIAREIRHAVNGWRHGAAVDAFAAECTEVLAAWDELRARARDEGNAVALSPAFRETLDWHGALMNRAASFRARPQTFRRLLSERAGIGEGELDELREVHARAGSYLRSVNARTASAVRRATQLEEARTEIVEVDAPAFTPEPAVDEHAQVQLSEPVTPIAGTTPNPPGKPCTTDWSATGTTLSPSPTAPTCHYRSCVGTTN